MNRSLGCVIVFLVSSLFRAQIDAASPLHQPQGGSAPGTSQVIQVTPQASSQFPPSEELKTAMMPFDQARRQPDDLTDADRLALKVGRNRAAAACLRTSPQAGTVALAPAELLALARLCLLGQQFQQAQKASTRYLQLDMKDGRRTAQELLTQAFLGMHDTGNAAIQVRSLLGEATYDASLQSLLMQVIGAGALRGGDWMHLTRDLCAAEMSNSLKQLEAGNGFPGVDSPPPSQLYRDTLVCVRVSLLLHDAIDSKTLGRVRDLPASLAWRSSAEQVPMQNALERFDSEQKRTPVLQIRGEHIAKSGAIAARSLDLQHGSFLLVPSTLWASDTVRVLSDLVSAAPHLPIYMLTSWAANTGGADQLDPQTLVGLRGLASQVLPGVSVVIVPDQILQRFHLDVYPCAIAVTDGTVRVSTILDSETAERLALIPSAS